MAIITISRGSYSMGKCVAEKVAKRLQYDLISRDILLAASERFNVPEIKLEKAIHNAPSILERYGHGKQTYIAYIRSALVNRVINNNIVYHGLAGHFLLKGITHILKVRITSNIENRVKNEIKQKNISESQAREMILEDDMQRRKWTKSLYGEDPWDSSLYDLTICIDKLSIENAVDFICKATESDAFQTTEKSIQKMKDLALACHIKAALIDDFPDVGITCEYGNLLVYLKSKDYGNKLLKRIKQLQNDIEGVYSLEIHSGIVIPPEAV